MTDLSRRFLFSGGRQRADSTLRTPWSGREAVFIDACTRSNACVAACHTGIVQRGPGGFPVIDFLCGECTFCYACASACPQALFAERHTTPWEYALSISERCMTQQQVECRSCQDSCEAGAILFRPMLGRIAAPQLDEAVCTACGACIAGCPVHAISIIKTVFTHTPTERLTAQQENR